MTIAEDVDEEVAAELSGRRANELRYGITPFSISSADDESAWMRRSRAAWLDGAASSSRARRRGGSAERFERERDHDRVVIGRAWRSA